MPEYTDAQLIDRMSHDDKLAFEQIFKSYYAELCRFCLKYVRVETTAEEIVQNIFINIWERRAQIIITSSIKAYLYTAVRNRSFNYIRLQLPKDQKMVPVDNMPIIETDSKEQDMIFDDLKMHVKTAIENLPTKCRIVFNLSRNSGLTYKEIAEELDISIKTVENQIGVALKKLRVQLRPIWDKVMILVGLIFFEFFINIF